MDSCCILLPAMTCFRIWPSSFWVGRNMVRGGKRTSFSDGKTERNAAHGSEPGQIWRCYTSCTYEKLDGNSESIVCNHLWCDSDGESCAMTGHDGYLQAYTTSEPWHAQISAPRSSKPSDLIFKRSGRSLAAYLSATWRRRNGHIHETRVCRSMERGWQHTHALRIT